MAMNKLLLAATGLATILALGQSLGHGHAQQNGGKPNEPFGVPLQQPQPGPSPYSLPTTPGHQRLPALPQPGAEFLGGTPNYAGNHFLQPGPESEKTSAIREYLGQNFDAPDQNQDIAIRPECGKWAICLQSYSGDKAASMAREMVFELRNNPAYKMNAFTHRQGVEDCKAEQKHIRDEIEKQRKMLAEQHLPNDMPVRIPVVRYEIQYAVLLAGYKDMESAKQAVMDLRAKKLPPLDVNKVKLNMQYVMKCNEKGAPVDGGYVAVSPFAQCMACPNPTVKTTRDTGISAQDMALMKKLNAQEPYSLLKCPKKLTLAVKQFSMPSEIPTAKSTAKSTSTWFLENIGLGGSSARVDTAAISAQNLADLLRKGQFEAYVLHTEFSSFVTVGSYDAEDDPRIARDRDLLGQINMQLNPAIRLAAQPRLMAVPK